MTTFRIVVERSVSRPGVTIVTARLYAVSTNGEGSPCGYLSFTESEWLLAAPMLEAGGFDIRDEARRKHP